jgi:hypothetical protein
MPANEHILLPIQTYAMQGHTSVFVGLYKRQDSLKNEIIAKQLQL